MNPCYDFSPEICDSMSLRYYHNDRRTSAEMPVLSLTPGFVLPTTTSSNPSALNPKKIGSSSTASSSGGSSSARSFAAELKQLAPDFQPGPFDVICARGSAAANSPGNQRFRATIKSILPEYATADSKLSKSLLVSKVVNSVRDFSPNGGFVKQLDDGFFYEIGDAAAREKIGQCIRDALHTKYKSSTRSKKPRRKELKELKKKKKAMVRQQPQPQKQIQVQYQEHPLDDILLEHCTTGFPELARCESKELDLASIFCNAMDNGLALDSLPLKSQPRVI